jgi:hypothetical protein
MPDRLWRSLSLAAIVMVVVVAVMALGVSMMSHHAMLRGAFALGKRLGAGGHRRRTIRREHRQQQAHPKH